MSFAVLWLTFCESFLHEI